MTTAASSGGNASSKQKRGDELRPDEERQPHPGHALGAQLDDRRDEIDRAEQRRRDQQNEPDQPERLAIENEVDTSGPLSAMSASGV